MRRKYQRELYAERVAYIKSKVPDACIGVDVITGFPGESDAHFEDSYQFINELDVSYLHVFTYSERAQTGALKMAGKVPVAVRKERTQRLRILSEKKRHAFYESQKGKIKSILFEAENDGGTMYGFSENYIKVEMPYDPMYVNEIREAKIGEQTADATMKISLTMQEDLPENLKVKLKLI
jgi:threonylcarbamoyladenosine tRNA methylthiotransferase MtaB